MATTIVFDAHFEAAHRLPHVPSGHKCGRLHGHSYRLEIHVAGAIEEPAGWVVDFATIEAAWLPLQAVLDHHLLNDVPGLQNPTCEVVAAWAWAGLKPSLTNLSAVVLHESHACRCIYTGP